jgi:O-acetyl-ADP-ribose deacetylase (regulator of RNase III)
MKIILTAIDQPLSQAWQKWCKFDFVEVYQGSIFDTKPDAVISPANGRGFMDGGIDDAYMKYFGEHVEARLQKTIKEDYDGELLVGQAVLVSTKHAAITYIISAPTMRVPMKLSADTVNPYLAAKAAILCALRTNEVMKQYTGDPNAREINRLAFPGLGTGVGGVGPELCAYQVAQAIRDTLVQKPMFPYSWQDSVYRHEQLINFGEEG